MASVFSEYCTLLIASSLLRLLEHFLYQISCCRPAENAKRGGQRKQQQIISVKRVVCPTPVLPCCFSIRPFQEALCRLQAYMPTLFILLPMVVKSINQKKGKICLVTEGSFLH